MRLWRAMAAGEWNSLSSPDADPMAGGYVVVFRRAPDNDSGCFTQRTPQGCRGHGRVLT
jgi:hypothetical protein